MFSELNPTVNYSPTFDVHSFCTRCLKLSLFLNTSVPGWIKDGTKLFASVEGQTLHAAKITLYPVYHLLKKTPLFLLWYLSIQEYYKTSSNVNKYVQILESPVYPFKFVLSTQENNFAFLKYIENPFTYIKWMFYLHALVIIWKMEYSSVQVLWMTNVINS